LKRGKYGLAARRVVAIGAAHLVESKAEIDSGQSNVDDFESLLLDRLGAKAQDQPCRNQDRH
jgi:hypothetical protein